MSQGIFTNKTSNVFNKKKKTDPVSYSQIMPVQQPKTYNNNILTNSYNRGEPYTSSIKLPTQQSKPLTWEDKYINNASYGTPKPYVPENPNEDKTQDSSNFDYYETYMNAIDKQNQNLEQKSAMQEQLAKQENDTYQRQLERIYGQTQNSLKSQIPALQKRSQSTQDLIQKGLENVKTQGAIAKTNIIDQTGATLRSQAQSKREVDAKRNAVFAGNNTTDSFGFGGYQMEQANADNDFLREQNITKRARDQQLASVDMQITSAEATAQKAVSDEISKFEDAVREINNSLNMNQIEKQNAIENSYTNLQKTLFSIRDNYNTTTAGLYEKQLELMKAVTDAQATGSQIGDDKLSPEFIASGMTRPVTAYDQLYLQKNGGDGKNKGQVVEAIKRLANSNGIGGMTGWTRTDMIPGSQAAQALNDWNTLKSMLSLESRTKLKGSGAISDFEAKVLERASTLGLDQNLSEDQFRARLNTLLNEIGETNTSADNTDALVAKYWGN